MAPAALVRDLLGSQEGLEGAAAGLLTEAEQRLVVRPKGGSSKSGWTTDEIPLLDEAESLINGRARPYGHIVVDEAQDLSPMQFRMVARRAPSGSLTILGDLAQATGAWSYDRWEEILAHLPEAAPVRTDELTLGYRAPGQVLELASRLLPVAAPAVTPTRSIRPGRDSPRLHQVPADQLFSESLAEATRLAGQGLLVGLVVAADQLAAATAEADGRADIGLLDRDGIAKPITLVDVPAVKGLEFDAVVVVEPSAIAGGDVRGLRLLYVAMTRPIRHLSIVHAEPLPTLLR